MKASHFQEKQVGLSNPFTLGRKKKRKKGIAEEVKV